MVILVIAAGLLWGIGMWTSLGKSDPDSPFKLSWIFIPITLGGMVAIITCSAITIFVILISVSLIKRFDLSEIDFGIFFVSYWKIFILIVMIILTYAAGCGISYGLCIFADINPIKRCIPFSFTLGIVTMIFIPVISIILILIARLIIEIPSVCKSIYDCVIDKQTEVDFSDGSYSEE